jgi:hypothetical protein
MDRNVIFLPCGNRLFQQVREGLEQILTSVAEELVGLVGIGMLSAFVIVNSVVDCILEESAVGCRWTNAAGGSSGPTWLKNQLTVA